MHSASQERNSKILTKAKTQHFKGTVRKVLSCLTHKFNQASKTLNKTDKHYLDWTRAA